MSGAELAVRAEAEDYAAWFRALADGTRVKIVSLLARHGRPMKVAEIVAAVQVGQSTVSQHLKVLAAVRFVLAERRGTARYYRINAACVSSFPTAAALVGGLAAPLPEYPEQVFLPSLPPFPGPVGLAIRPMLSADAEQVLAVYQAGLDAGDASFETAVPSWAAFDAARLPGHRHVRPPTTPANCSAGSRQARCRPAASTPAWWSTRCTWPRRHGAGASATRCSRRS